MKITIKQLKQLIKEQVEEGWSDRDSSLDVASPANEQRPYSKRPVSADNDIMYANMIDDLIDAARAWGLGSAEEGRHVKTIRAEILRLRFGS